MAKKYTVATGKSKNAGYSGTFGKKITSKKTGKTYTGKNATKAAAKRRVMFEHMK
ncbi:MAG: hypothetical protein ACRCXT_08595 [Paraclostridium sp.]